MAFLQWQVEIASHLCSLIDWFIHVHVLRRLAENIVLFARNLKDYSHSWAMWCRFDVQPV